MGIADTKHFANRILKDWVEANVIEGAPPVKVKEW